MKKLLFILFFGSIYYSYGQISVINNFENSNCEFLNFDDSNNLFLFRPELKDSLNTTRCWFYFGLTGFDTSRNLILSEKVASLYHAPSNLIYSYDKKNWKRKKYDSVVNNIRYYSKKYTKDTVWFATGYPYTYSKLLKYSDSISAYIDTFTLCMSEGGLRVPIYKIQDKKAKPEYMILIIARQHAFESLSNYFLEGMINFLTDTDRLSIELKKKVCLYIVPMMDVDNVYKGASGRMQKPIDFNRNWTIDSYWSAVAAVKELVNEKTKNQELLVFLDIHSTYPGGFRPLTGIYNIYNSNEPNFFNFKHFCRIFKKSACYSLIEINGLYNSKKRGFADEFFGKNPIERYNAKYFSTTIECDWNTNNNGEELTIDELKQTGYLFAKSIAIFLNKKNFTAK